MLDKRWTEIFENAALTEKMAGISEPEKLQKLLRANGYDFTLEEISAAGEELMASYAAQSDGEITENDLEEVAGGIRVSSLAKAGPALLRPMCVCLPIPKGKR